MNIRRENKTSLCLSAGIFLLFSIFVYFANTPSVQADQADHLLINEIQIDSISGTGGSSDDFVELYNPTGSDVILDTWSIQKHSKSSTSPISKFSLSKTIPAGGYFLIVRGNASTSQSLKDMADVLIPSSFSIASDNVVFLVNDDAKIENQEDNNIVDYVGMGDSEVFEGSASASNPGETKSITRVIKGEDSDDNSADFKILSTPSPQNSSFVEDSPYLDGTVLVTIIPSDPAVQDITPSSARIVFAVNSAGLARVDFGLDDTYGNFSLDEIILANTETSIDLSGLSCGSLYHYSIYAENSDASDSYATTDASFSTLPCGISIDAISMTKTSARANDDYVEGWAWEFDITVWDLTETSLKMKFGAWTGDDNLDAGANMQFSVDGVDWIDIDANDTYSTLGADINMIDEDLVNAGRQVNIQVRMKIPVGTSAGVYNSNYGIFTE